MNDKSTNYNTNSFMHNLFLLFFIAFVGYKKSAIILWLLFPVIFLISAQKDFAGIYYMNYFMIAFVIGTFLYYLAYTLLLRWLALMAKKLSIVEQIREPQNVCFHRTQDLVCTHRNLHCNNCGKRF